MPDTGNGGHGGTPMNLTNLIAAIVAMCNVALLVGCADTTISGSDYFTAPLSVDAKQPRRTAPIVKDTEHPGTIPKEFSKHVSSRGPTTWNARARMCREAAVGYCNHPNIPHCHGTYCHAHPKGDVRHTH